MELRLLPYTPDRDVYRLLGVPATADAEEITAACRRLARTFHPDHNRSQRATQEMQVVNVVRRVMTAPAARAVYDRERRRFHASLGRPRGPSAAVDVAPLRPVEVRRPSSLERYLRATIVGLRAVAASLAPPRCRSCRIVIAGDDAYCAACGTPLLTTGG